MRRVDAVRCVTRGEYKPAWKLCASYWLMPGGRLRLLTLSVGMPIVLPAGCKNLAAITVQMTTHVKKANFQACMRHLLHRAVITRRLNNLRLKAKAANTRYRHHIHVATDKGRHNYDRYIRFRLLPPQKSCASIQDIS